MADTFYPKQSVASTAVFLPAMARFLINDLGGFTGPGWTVVDTYSQAAATPHEVPGTPTNMDSLAADNGWRTGTILTGDYIILESASGAFPFQLGLEYQAATTIRMIVAPKAGFDTAEDDNDMTAAGNWTEPVLTTLDITTAAGLANYSLVADEDRFIFAHEDGVTYAFTYIGKYDDPHTGDDYTAIQYHLPATVYSNYSTGIGGNSGAYRKLSMVDDTTVLSCYGLGSLYQGNVGDLATIANYMEESSTSEQRCMPIYLMSATASHFGVFGKLRGVYFTNTAIIGSGTGTLNSMAQAFILGTAGQGPIVFDWDSTTPF